LIAKRQKNKNDAKAISWCANILEYSRQHFFSMQDIMTCLACAVHSIHLFLNNHAWVHELIEVHPQDTNKREMVLRTLYDRQATWSDPLIQATGIDEIVSNYQSLSAIASVRPLANR
jgi:hypothetical protein